MGSQGDVDTEYLETYWDTNECIIQPKATGSGSAGRTISLRTGTNAARVDLYYNGNGALTWNETSNAYWGNGYFRFRVNAEPFPDDALNLGGATLRWANVYSVDGDFSGTVTADSISASSSAFYIDQPVDSGSVRWRFNGNQKWFMGKGVLHGGINGEQDLGTPNVRFGNVYFVDGSFSGNLVSEAGGALKLYNLGTEGDTDTEFGYVQMDAGTLKIGVDATGSGSLSRPVSFYTNSSFGFKNAGGQTRFNISTSNVTTYLDFRPNVTASYDCGTTTYRWSNVASVDGDFSGDVTMSGLPTSDPLVAGQLYTTTGGALKVSAG